MYAAKLTVPDIALQVPRDLPARSRAVYARRVQQEVKPALEQVVEQRLAPYPGAVRLPFVFATEKSRRFYFARFRGRIPYPRSGKLARSWLVRIDRRESDGQIQIVNTAPAAGYVFGPGNPLASFRQVPGHARTGWARGFPQTMTYIQQLGTDLLIAAWYETVGEIWR